MQKENQEPFCKKCGKEIDSESNYCKYCGNRLIGTKRVSYFPKWISASASVLLVFLSVIFSAYCLINYQNGVSAMGDCRFISAQKYFGRIPFYELLFTNDCEYIQAGVLMEQGDYIEALNAFNNVNYPVPISIIENIQEELYKQSQSYYRKGDYQNSIRGFRSIQDYKNSEDYILLIRGHNSPYMINYNDLLGLIGFEDASDIILNNDGFFRRFMIGDWKAEKGNMYFRIDYTGHSHFNLPFIDVSSEYYELSSGIYFDVHSDGSRTKQFKFSIVDQNTASVLCYKNNEKYTLIRQQT